MENDGRKHYVTQSPFFDYAMGAVWLIMGLVILFGPKLGVLPNKELFQSTIIKLYAGLCLAYGSWRVFKGIKRKQNQ